MLTEIFIFVITLLLLCLLWFKRQRPKNFPPGPQPYPILGNLLTLGLEPHIAFWKLSKQYGPIVGAKFGPDLCVCLHGADLIKEAFSSGLFTDRRPRDAFKFVAGDEMGIANSSGTVWMDQRRFAFRQLKDFGFGKSSMEDLILEEVRNLLKYFRAHSRSKVAVQHRFALAVLNSLWKILTGERFDHDDHKLHKIMEDVDKAARILLGFDAGKNLLIFFYPKIGRMFPKWSGWQKLEEVAQERIDMFDKIIADHDATLEEGGDPRDFVDAYLTEIRRTTDPKSSFHRETSGVRSLKSIMADFFVGGTDTTAVSLTWLMLYLLHNPRVQEKLHGELYHVVGPEQEVVLGDRKSLPYTEAVLLETLRLSSIAGVGIPHVPSADVVFHGYTIPKGTLILANFYGNHHDPQIWGEDVDEFKPERFLSQDESVLLKNEFLIPFSTGKRVCPGESLARNSLFLFAANLMLHFKVTGVPGQPLPPLDYKRGELTLAPVSDMVVMTAREVES